MVLSKGIIKKSSIGCLSLSITLGFVTSGCTDKSDEDKSEQTSTLVVSGTLQISANAPSLRLADPPLNEMKIYCVTFETPPTAGEGNVNADGSFTVNLENSVNKPFGCFVRDTANTKTYATLSFNDSSAASINGSGSASNSISLAGNTDFGSVTLNLAQGTAIVDKSKFNNNVSTVTGDFWDFTGTWKFSALDTALPDGYSEPCAANANNCYGPQVDTEIYMKRLAGKKFTPDATCSGAANNNENITTCNGETDTNTPVHALQVWEAEGRIATCGSKLGFTDAQAKAYGKIALDEATVGLTFGDFSWATSNVTAESKTGTITDGWKFDEATFSYDWWESDGAGGWTQTGTSGQKCATGSTDLTDSKCYANFYHNHLESSSYCVKDMRFDWDASSNADFAKQHDNKPPFLYVFELAQYNSLNSVSAKTSENHTNCVMVTESGGKRCHSCDIHDETSFIITKNDDGTALIDFTTVKTLTDNHETCNTEAAKQELRIGEMRAMMKMEKQ